MFGVFRKIAAISFTLAPMLFQSCQKATLEAAYAKQYDKIEAFVKKQTATDSTLRVVYRDESTRIVMKEGTGEEVGANGLVRILYAGYDFSSGSATASTLFVTNSEDVASGSKWVLTDSTAFTPVVLNLGDESIYEGLRSGLTGARASEECWILFTGKFASPKDKIGTIPANAALAFHVWVDDIEN